MPERRSFLLCSLRRTCFPLTVIQKVASRCQDKNEQLILAWSAFFDLHNCVTATPSCFTTMVMTLWAVFGRTKDWKIFDRTRCRGLTNTHVARGKEQVHSCFTSKKRCGWRRGELIHWGTRKTLSPCVCAARATKPAPCILSDWLSALTNRSLHRCARPPLAARWSC